MHRLLDKNVMTVVEGVQRLRRRSAHYSILFCSLNSIDSTSLPPVGATWAIPSDEDLSYYDSPIYFGILENKKRLEIEVKKQDLQDFYPAIFTSDGNDTGLWFPTNLIIATVVPTQSMTQLSRSQSTTGAILSEDSSAVCCPWFSIFRNFTDHLPNYWIGQQPRIPWETPPSVPI